MKRYHVWTNEYRVQYVIDPEIGGPWEDEELHELYDAANAREAKRMFVREHRRDIERYELWTEMHVQQVDPSDPHWMLPDEWEEYKKIHPDWLEELGITEYEE